MTPDRAESVTSSGGNGRQSAMQSQPRKPGRIGLPGNYKQWLDRQVQYLRSVPDEDRRNRYYSGLEYVYGVAVRASIEAEVERLGPAAVLRRLRDSSSGYRGRRA